MVLVNISHVLGSKAHLAFIDDDDYFMILTNR